MIKRQVYWFFFDWHCMYVCLCIVFCYRKS